MNRAFPIGILSLILTVLVSSCQTPAPVTSNASSPAASAPAGPTATPNAEKTGTRGPHCDDPPPANPSTCKPPIDQPFVVGCTLPFTGLSHDIDKHCPNEGCAKKENDKAQNKIKNNFCAVGPAIQINAASIDKLQAAVDQLVQQGTFKYGKSSPRLIA
jgi:hypothetical protein